MARNFSCIYTIQHTLADVPFGVLHRIRRNFDDKLFCARELEYADTCTSHHKLLKLDIDLLQKFKHNRIVRVLEVIHEEDAGYTMSSRRMLLISICWRCCKRQGLAIHPPRR